MSDDVTHLDDENNDVTDGQAKFYSAKVHLNRVFVQFCRSDDYKD